MIFNENVLILKGEYEMNKENIGGITFADVVKFQIKIMMGAQYDRVICASEKEAKEGEKEIIIACLRIAWNDAFRHVTKNKPKKTIKDKLKNKNLNEYICEILSSKKVFNTFIEYAKSKNTEDRVTIIKKAIKDDEFTAKFSELKEIRDEEKPLCFGHIQKLFNMAIKYYLCLYFCGEYLNLNESYFTLEMAALETADCPIDSIILNEIEMSNIKWSKIGIDDTENSVDNYTTAQKKISENPENNGNSNLAYDFKFWQNKLF